MDERTFWGRPFERAFRCNSAGRVVPVYRVKAWRVANEDRPSWDVVFRRAPPAGGWRIDDALAAVGP